jgi:hypothetical protein
LKKSKLHVEVFLPFGFCACSFSSLMEKVGKVTSNFKDTVEVQMRSTASKEAREYGVQSSCVIVDKTVRLSADFDEKQLEEAIIQKISKL